MGNQASKKQPDERGFFLDGPTNFVYNEQRPIFEKSNGLLFRLINTEENQWAYYNDTKKYEFHVTVTFGPGSSDLQAMGSTSLVELTEGGWTAKTIVYPGLTEPFVSGNVVGFDSVVNAVLLTTEYKEKCKEEKRAAKKAAKRAKRGEAAEEPAGEDNIGGSDELGSDHENNNTTTTNSA